MEDIEEVKKRYKLSDEQHNEIEKSIMSIMFYNKYPTDNPQAIIDIAPPASGKTGLNSYGYKQFKDNNVIVINSDELKPYHPKVDEIAKLYPQYYTKVTDQESNSWTSEVFDRALREGYNVIFEGTGRNARILETIRTKMQGYNVSVRALAVNELNCLLSTIERYIYQVQARGWGRLITLDHFYETYSQMPNTIDAIEKSNVIQSVEIFKRGDEPSCPKKIYDSRDIENGRFPNAKFAILGGRAEDEKNARKNMENKITTIRNFLLNKETSDEEKNIFEKIQSLYQGKSNLEMSKE